MKRATILEVPAASPLIGGTVMAAGANRIVGVTSAEAKLAERGNSDAVRTPSPAVSFERARAAALRARPGTVTEHGLENEVGGSGLRYSFVIEQGGKTTRSAWMHGKAKCWNIEPKERDRIEGNSDPYSWP